MLETLWLIVNLHNLDNVGNSFKKNDLIHDSIQQSLCWNFFKKIFYYEKLILKCFFLSCLSKILLIPVQLFFTLKNHLSLRELNSHDENKKVLFSLTMKRLSLSWHMTQMKQLNNPKRVKMLSNYPSDRKMTIYVKFNS